jgi:hypothetical protein
VTRVYKRLVDLTGQRQGSLVALRPNARGGWWVRCDCGKIYRVTLSAWFGYSRDRGGIRSCRDCIDRAAAANKTSVQLPDGRTIAQIARATGLRLDTVYHRHLRGWPAYRLGEVTRPHNRTAP